MGTSLDLMEIKKQVEPIRYFLSKCEKFSDLYGMSLFGYNVANFSVSLGENQPEIPMIIHIAKGVNPEEKISKVTFIESIDNRSKTNIRKVSYEQETGECLVNVVKDREKDDLLLENTEYEKISTKEYGNQRKFGSKKQTIEEESTLDK